MFTFIRAFHWLKMEKCWINLIFLFASMEYLFCLKNLQRFIDFRIYSFLLSSSTILHLNTRKILHKYKQTTALNLFFGCVEKIIMDSFFIENFYYWKTVKIINMIDTGRISEIYCNCLYLENNHYTCKPNLWNTLVHRIFLTQTENHVPPLLIPPFFSTLIINLSLIARR